MLAGQGFIAGSDALDLGAGVGFVGSELGRLLLERRRVSFDLIEGGFAGLGTVMRRISGGGVGDGRLTPGCVGSLLQRMPRVASYDPPAYEYVAFIDEAGDTGLKNVRPIDLKGGTEWFVIGATLVRRANEKEVPKWVGNILADIEVRQRPDLHFRLLSPTRQVRVCALMANLPAIYFAVTSNKRNMRRYRNERVEAKVLSAQWFYNWCIRILMERVTDLVLRDSVKRFGSPRIVKFIFSDTGGHSYSQTKAYHALLKTQARASSTFLQKRVPKWEVMDYRLVSNEENRNNAGLQLADVVASSFYTAIDKLDTGPCNPRAAELLKPRMAFEKVGDEKSITDFGLVLQPTPDYAVTIDEDQRQIFRFYGYPFAKK